LCCQETGALEPNPDQGQPRVNVVAQDMDFIVMSDAFVLVWQPLHQASIVEQEQGIRLGCFNYRPELAQNCRVISFGKLFLYLLGIPKRAANQDMKIQHDTRLQKLNKAINNLTSAT